MIIILLFLNVLFVNGFINISIATKKCIRLRRKIRNKIDYCPHIIKSKNDLFEKYTKSKNKLDKKIRYLELVKNRKMNEIYDKNLIDETITASSADFSDNISEELKEFFNIWGDFNKQYATIFALILSEVIKFNYNETVSDRKKLNKNLSKIFFRNIVWPMMLHDIFNSIFVNLKQFWHSHF